MTNGFGATSTTEDVLSGIDLHGKRILVTGVSAGIGVETARALAAHGAHVTGAVRDCCGEWRQLRVDHARPREAEKCTRLRRPPAG